MFLSLFEFLYKKRMKSLAFLIIAMSLVYMEYKSNLFKNTKIYLMIITTSSFYKSKWIFLPIFAILFLQINELFHILEYFLLDIVSEFFPSRLNRLKFQFINSIFMFYFFPQISLLSTQTNLLSDIQLICGSFQAIRVYEFHLSVKKLRTDLGTIYYKLQIIKVIFAFSSSNKFQNLLKEMLILIIIIIAVYKRPQMNYVNNNRKIHGILMRISFLWIFFDRLFN